MSKLGVLTSKKSMRNLKISGPLNVRSSENGAGSPSDSTNIHSSFHSQNSERMFTPRTTPENTVILITKFDFKAENPNELSVGIGEALKLIERKGNGWILVKPIGRISEPGLIPASYARVVNMGNKSENYLDRKASTDDRLPSSKKEHSGNELSAPHTNKTDSLNSLSSSSAVSSRKNSRHMITSSPKTHKYSSTQSSGSSESEQHFSFQSYTSSSTGNVTSTDEVILSSVTPYPSSGLVRNASCHSGRYWYRVDVTMSDGKKRYLCRYYQDFYKLHCSIMEHLRSFPDFEENEELYLSKLPALPDPIPRPDLQTLSSILLQRVQALNVYFFKIVQNKYKLDYLKIVDEWSNLRLGDLEVNTYESIKNEEIERLLQPMPTKLLNKPVSPRPSSSSSSVSSGDQQDLSSHQKRPSLSISTSVTPPLPAPNTSEFFNPFHPFRKTSSSSSLNTVSSPPSPMVWQSPTFTSTPTWGNSNERSRSTPTIYEGSQESYYDWLNQPTQPLNSRKRNVSLPVNSSTAGKPAEYVKVKVYSNDEIFAIRVKNKTTLDELKQSILTRLECDINNATIRLYYKNQSKNYFSPLNDELDMNSAFDQPKVAIKVHLWTKEETDRPL